MKALIKVGYECNNHCVFCHTAELRPNRGSSSRAVKQKIVRALRLGCDTAVLSGGEPTMRRELLAWARLAHQLGLRFGLVTNGRMLAYPQLVDKLCGFGLDYVHVSLHGGRSQVHNRMVRADSFDDALAAIGNLARRDVELTVNTVVTTANIDGLAEVVDCLKPFGRLKLKLSMVEPKGAAAHRFEKLVPTVSAVAERIREAFGYARQNAPDLVLAHEGMPLCLLPGLVEHANDLRHHGFRFMSEVSESDFFPVDNRNKSFAPACDGCALRGACPGLYTGYLQQRGEEELQPLSGEPPSRFDLGYEHTIEWQPGSPCPILEEGLTPFDRGRDRFVREGARLHRYHSDSRAFDDGQLEAFRDREGPLVIEDDAGNGHPLPVRHALHREPTCGDCPALRQCPGALVAGERLASGELVPGENGAAGPRLGIVRRPRAGVAARAVSQQENTSAGTRQSADA